MILINFNNNNKEYNIKKYIYIAYLTYVLNGNNLQPAIKISWQVQTARAHTAANNYVYTLIKIY